MPTLRSATDAQVNPAELRTEIDGLVTAAPYRTPACRAGLTVMRDIVLSVVCGASVGLLVAMVGDSF
jgi:hypothetical protein